MYSTNTIQNMNNSPHTLARGLVQSICIEIAVFFALYRRSSYLPQNIIIPYSFRHPLFRPKAGSPVCGPQINLKHCRGMVPYLFR
jgi:hypothetical protein